MKLLLSSILILFLIASSAIAKPITADVSGAVLAAETNKPIAGATISFFANTKHGLSPSPFKVLRSDNSGSFTTKIPPGDYTFVTKADGFALISQYAFFSTKNQEKLSIYLNKPLQVTGKLVDKNGNPMSEVTIIADRWNRAKTAQNGSFQFDGLNPAGYGFTLDKPGWLIQENYRSFYDVKDKSDMGNVVARKAGKIVVTVNPVTYGGGKIEKIGIFINGTTFRNLKTDSRGVATFNNLPPGNYTVSLSDERLKESSKDLEISDGETTEVIFNPVVKPPNISIEQYRDLFLPNKGAKTDSYSLWVKNAEVTISRLNSEYFFHGINSVEETKSFPVVYKNVRNSYLRKARIQIPPLKPGAYIMTIQGNGATSRFRFTVTDLGLIAKASPNGVLLYTTNLITGAPVPNVKIISQPSGFIGDNIIGTFTTDSNGLAEGVVSSESQKLSAINGDSLAFLEISGSGDSSQKDSIKGYIYTDRPAYRPGQTVYYKGILRQLNGEKYTLPNIKSVHITVNNDNDNTICENDSDISSTGSFYGECQIPASPSLGDYSINAASGGQTWQGSFRILEYRKPEFEVKISPDKPLIVNGDSTNMRINAHYYFGAPVAKGKVNWRMYIQPAWGFGNDAQDYDDGDGSYDGGYSDFVGEGEITLDDNGEGIVPVTAKQHDTPFIYTIEADVTDISSRKVTSSGNLTVVPSLVSLNLKTDKYLVKPGQDVKITARSKDWDNNPLSLPV
ncbi:MAG: MG2 domain-containing protein, partial [Desulfuromonadales bacterium]|nr:MG2 domain-containing protein [Desulfuromonadales bacterium]